MKSGPGHEYDHKFSECSSANLQGRYFDRHEWTIFSESMSVGLLLLLLLLDIVGRFLSLSFSVVFDNRRFAGTISAVAVLLVSLLFARLLVMVAVFIIQGTRTKKCGEEKD